MFSRKIIDILTYSSYLGDYGIFDSSYRVNAISRRSKIRKIVPMRALIVGSDEYFRFKNPIDFMFRNTAGCSLNSNDHRIFVSGICKLSDCCITNKSIKQNGEDVCFNFWRKS